MFLNKVVLLVFLFGFQFTFAQHQQDKCDDTIDAILKKNNYPNNEYIIDFAIKTKSEIEKMNFKKKDLKHNGYELKPKISIRKVPYSIVTVRNEERGKDKDIFNKSITIQRVTKYDKKAVPRIQESETITYDFHKNCGVEKITHFVQTDSTVRRKTDIHAHMCNTVNKGKKRYTNYTTNQTALNWIFDNGTGFGINYDKHSRNKAHILRIERLCSSVDLMELATDDSGQSSSSNQAQ
jgi:hypothetical protein